MYSGYFIIVLLYLLHLFEDKECREFSRYISYSELCKTTHALLHSSEFLFILP